MYHLVLLNITLKFFYHVSGFNIKMLTSLPLKHSLDRCVPPVSLVHPVLHLSLPSPTYLSNASLISPIPYVSRSPIPHLSLQSPTYLSNASLVPPIPHLSLSFPTYLSNPPLIYPIPHLTVQSLTCLSNPPLIYPIHNLSLPSLTCPSNPSLKIVHHVPHLSLQFLTYPSYLSLVPTVPCLSSIPILCCSCSLIVYPSSPSLCTLFVPHFSHLFLVSL